MSPQGGIFALGTSAHAYLEFDRIGAGDGRELVAAVASLREPRTTMGGVNLVAGFRPELWRAVAPDDAPGELEGFNEVVVGSDGFVMPATQHDAVLWLSGAPTTSSSTLRARRSAELAGLASVEEETSSWPYQHDRDLTGFIDGSENPTLIEAPGLVLVPEGQPGAGGTVLLLQKWVHDAAAWESLPVAEQERVIGRTKLDSVELEDKPPDSHVASTDQERFGEIFRRNMPYGTVTDHGTMFVGFGSEQRPLAAMLESMAGLPAGAATRSRATPGRSRVPTTSSRRSNRSCGVRSAGVCADGQSLLQGSAGVSGAVSAAAHRPGRASRPRATAPRPSHRRGRSGRRSSPGTCPSRSSHRRRRRAGR